MKKSINIKIRDLRCHQARAEACDFHAEASLMFLSRATTLSSLVGDENGYIQTSRDKLLPTENGVCLNYALQRTMKFFSSLTRNAWWRHKDDNTPYREIIEKCRPAVIFINHSDIKEVAKYTHDQQLMHWPEVERVIERDHPIEVYLLNKKEMPSPKYIIMPRRFKMGHRKVDCPILPSTIKKIETLFPEAAVIELVVDRYNMGASSTYVMKAQRNLREGESLRGSRIINKDGLLIKSTGEEVYSGYGEAIAKVVLKEAYIEDLHRRFI
jgi:hypothetical protein